MQLSDDDLRRVSPAMRCLLTEARNRGISDFYRIDDLADEIFGGYQMLTDDVETVARIAASNARGP